MLFRSSFPTKAPATAELDFSPDEAGGETLPATEHVGWSDGVTEVDDVTLPDAQKPAEAFVVTGWSAFPSPDTARRMANAIRVLSMDAIEKARSGHPGMPMGMADIAVALWGAHFKHDPAQPGWFDRDRFVLSNGHGESFSDGLFFICRCRNARKSRPAKRASEQLLARLSKEESLEFEDVNSNPDRTRRWLAEFHGDYAQ